MMDAYSFGRLGYDAVAQEIFSSAFSSIKSSGFVTMSHYLSNWQRNLFEFEASSDDIDDHNLTKLIIFPIKNDTTSSQIVKCVPKDDAILGQLSIEDR